MSLADHQIVTNLINIMGPGVTSSSLRKVTWESRSEPLSNLNWQPSWENILKSYSHLRATEEAEAAHARTLSAPLDSHLTNSERQGIWSQSLNIDVNTLQRISELTVFGTQPLNPEFDITIITPFKSVCSPLGPKRVSVTTPHLSIAQQANALGVSQLKG